MPTLRLRDLARSTLVYCGAGLILCLVGCAPEGGDSEDQDLADAAADALDATDVGDTGPTDLSDVFGDTDVDSPVPDVLTDARDGDALDAMDGEADASPGPEPPPHPEITDARLEALQATMTAALGGTSVAGRTLTALAVEAETGRVLFASDPDLPLVPASNTKLFTTAAAFALLGEDYRFRTRVYGTAAPDGDGTLAGDLVVVVEHDFTFSTDFYASARFPFDQLASALYAGGLRQVTGTVRLTGELGYDAYRFATYAPDAHRAAGVAAFSAALTSTGIDHGATASGPGFEPPGGGLLLADWESVPLAVACVPLNSISHNEYADLLMRHLGYTLRGQSSYADGFAEVEEWLAASGLDTTGLTLSDGSGLSYANHVSARHLVGLFRLMADLPVGAAWLRTLSIAGVRGTLAGRMAGADTVGRVFGKSGTLNISIATSGVLVNRHDGRRYVFALVMNDVPNQSAARLAQDTAVTALAGDLLEGDARPAMPELTSVTSLGDGRRVTATWEPVGGAEGYVVWRSDDGNLWPRDSALYTLDTAHVLAPAESGAPVYVRVTAVSAAGESDASDVYAARPGEGPAVALIVDGNERWQRQPVAENTLGGAHAFVVDYAEVLDVAGFDTATARAVRLGDVLLGGYEAVFWGVAEESTVDETFDPTEQTILAGYAASGGNLLVSGAEIGWDLVEHGTETDAAFFGEVLKAAYVGDDAGTYLVRGRGGIFASLPLMGFYTPGEIDVAFPERLGTVEGSVAVLEYVGGTGGVAAVQYDGDYRLVHLGFPFESLDSRPARADVMARVVAFFGL